MFEMKKKKVFFWSPMSSHVGTIKAVIGMAESISSYNNYNIFILNIIGEFDKFKNIKYFNFIDFFRVEKIIPKTGIFSKIFIHIFSFFSLPFLIYHVLKHKPDYFITCMVGYLPIFIKLFCKKTVIINSIQGHPKLNFFRKFIWKFFYTKSDFLLTMTNITRITLINFLAASPKTIFKVDNPIISSEIKKKAMEDIDDVHRHIFSKKVFCSIGRLTRQKNFLELFLALEKYYNDYDKNFNLIVIGEGEDYFKLQKYINDHNIKNFFLLGFRQNPYNYLYRSNIYISTSLWEEPGHTLIEAGYLNVPILTSNCLTGPEEIIIHKENGYKYRLNDINDFSSKLCELNSLSDQSLLQLKLNMKKITKNYTGFKFINSLNKFLFI